MGGVLSTYKSREPAGPIPTQTGFSMARYAIRNPLLLPELSRYILDYLDASRPVQTESFIIGVTVHKTCEVSRKAFYALAQTCRALSEPSLDRLWWRLDSLVPLMRCFAQVVDEDRAMVNPSHLLFECLF